MKSNRAREAARDRRHRTGRNFIAPLSSSQLFFDSVNNLSFVSNAQIVEAGTIKVLIPSDLAVGTYDVVVKNPDGQLGRATAALTVTARSSGCSCSLGTGGRPELPTGLVIGNAALLLLILRRLA